MTEAQKIDQDVPTTADDLLRVMGENIAALRAGTTTPAVANAVVNSSATMLRIVKLQLEYAKATNRTPSIPLLLTGGREG